jgi:hypothetical protein
MEAFRLDIPEDFPSGIKRCNRQAIPLKGSSLPAQYFACVEPAVGIEPTTCRLRITYR